MRQAVQRTEGHRLQGCVAEPDHLGRDEAFVAGAKRQPVTDRCQSGQPFHLDDEAQEIGHGAADLGHLGAAQAGFAGIHTIREIISSH